MAETRFSRIRRTQRYGRSPTTIPQSQVVFTQEGIEPAVIPAETQEKPKPESPQEPQPEGRRMTVADLTPEQKAEHAKIDAEAREKLKPIEAELATKKARWQELEKKQWSSSIKDVEGDPMRLTGLTEEESREFIELGDNIREIQNEYDAMARAYQEKLLAAAGVTRAYTGPTTQEAAQAYEQTTIMGKGGETAFNYAKDKGLIPKDAIYVPQEGTKWGYTTPGQQRDQINQLVTAGVLTTEDLRGLDLKADLSGKLKLAVDTYNKKQFQNTINDLVTQGVLDTDALRDIGDDPDKIQKYVDKYNKAQFRDTVNDLVSKGVLDTQALRDIGGDPAKIQPYVDAYNTSRQSALDRISKYQLGKDNYDLVAAIAGGVSKNDLQLAGFDAADIEMAGGLAGKPVQTATVTPSRADIGGARYENEAELRAYGQELATTNPDLFKVYKDAFASGNWGAYEQAVQTYNDNIEAEEKQFKANNTKLVDGAWLSNKDLADIKADSPKLYDAVLSQGYDKTFGYIDTLKEKNPKLYVVALQKYDLLPANTEYFDTLPDGTIRVTDKTQPDYGPKTITELSKKIGLEAADILVPGVWARNLKIEKQKDGTYTSNMPAWEIGLNAGLDLLVLIPVAGWGAKAVGKGLLKAGTTTIEKSLAKDLPKSLIKAGERGLANEAKIVAKSIPKIQKAAVAMEKAAVKGVKVATQTTNPKVLAKAYQAEQKAKQAFVTTFQTFGNDLAALNSKITYTSVKSVGKEGLAKTVGLAKQAPDFAEYLTGSLKDLARAELQAKYFAKTTPTGGAAVARNIERTIKAYQEVPKTIGEVAKASGIALTKGKKAAASYLRGESGLARGKVLTPTQLKATGKKQADAYLKKLQSRLAKEGAAGRARAEKYLGKQTTLDKWDAFIKDSWHPKSPYEAGRPSIWGEPRGGVSTITKVGGGGARATEKVAIQAGDEMALSGLAGKALFRIITKPDGSTVIVPSPDTVKAPSKVPQIPGLPSRKPGKIPVKAPSKTPVKEPSVKPGVVPVKIPAKALAKVPSEMPTISPAKVPELTPAKAPAKEPLRITEVPTIKEPAKIPARIPEKIPAKVPEPTPAKTPVKAPVKAPVKIPVKTKLKVLILPFREMTDEEKREAIAVAGGAFTWRQGKLSGKPVHHVVVNPFRQQDKTTVLGKAPEGALDVTGKGQSERSITLTRGEAPKGKREYEGGAIDPIVSPTGTKRGVRIDFVYDRSVKRPGKQGQKRTNPPRLHSKREGRIFRTRIGRGSVLSRRPLGRRNRR